VKMGKGKNFLLMQEVFFGNPKGRPQKKKMRNDRSKNNTKEGGKTPNDSRDEWRPKLRRVLYRRRREKCSNLTTHVRLLTRTSAQGDGTEKKRGNQKS